MTGSGVASVRVIDSHTGGEPTRVVVSGGPDLSGTTLAEKRSDFIARYDACRRAVVNEPRGSDVLVGALLTEPSDPSSAAGVLFFNNVGCLGMCGHGMIGVVTTLAYLGRLHPGEHRIETPVGLVTTRLHPSGEVSVENVPSYRYRKAVAVEVPGYGPVTGDVAWGGNWFYLVQEHGLSLERECIDELVAFAWAVRQALEAAGVCGRDGEPIDHIELFGPARTAGANSRNFVLCPGRAYDRSPCGTGTSAKMACLFEDGKLAERAPWRQESITGSVFEGSVRRDGSSVRPTITGRAFVTAEATLLMDTADPFCWGLH